MQVTLNIRTDNAAFEDAGAGHEVARILRKLADKIEQWPGANEWHLALLDINGNRVGHAEASE